MDLHEEQKMGRNVLNFFRKLFGLAEPIAETVKVTPPEPEPAPEPVDREPFKFEYGEVVKHKLTGQKGVVSYRGYFNGWEIAKPHEVGRKILQLNTVDKDGNICLWVRLNTEQGKYFREDEFEKVENA